MDNVSTLLEYLLRDATERANKDKKKSLTANYFMMAVLHVMWAAENDQLPKTLLERKPQWEIATMKELLKPYALKDYKAAAEGIRNMAWQSSPSESAEKLAFGRIGYNAGQRARKNGDGIVTASMILEMCLKTPTAAIAACVIEKKSDTTTASQETGAASQDTTALDEEITKTTLAQMQELQELKTVLDAARERRTAESGASKLSEPKEEVPAEGVEQLAELVERTRSIQRTLLNTVFGQDQAINAFVSGYFQAELMAQSQKAIKKPQATFLFAGPPGVGKTFLAEKAAESLGLPYKRFDMSEYADKEANLEFCGSDKVYKNGKAGNVTSFVAENPHCVLLFDEIEKAHINVIYLFLQILDAGRIRDNFTDEEVSFSRAVIIFTTNVGKNLYDDPSVVNLSALPRKKILKALASDINPVTQAPLFPAAICSRFASGNVVMFNHLGAGNLFTIADRTLQENARSFRESMGVTVSVSDSIPSAILFSEGGKADARTVKGKAGAFFHEELYELFRLMSSDSGAIRKLREIKMDVSLNGAGDEIRRMFVNREKSGILIFAEENAVKRCCRQLKGFDLYTADSLEKAKEHLFNHDITLVLCDVRCKAENGEYKVLNAEDIDSEGRSFLSYVLDHYTVPVYLLQDQQAALSQEEFLSFSRLGVRGIVSADQSADAFTAEVREKCEVAYQQDNILKLAKENKVLSYKTEQHISDGGTVANIRLFDFRLGLATDVEDSKSIVEGVSKPKLRFADVIGAEDAKGELAYFVEYLKNPVKYMRQGVRAPKGILLYGPPGTGKTLLAKAMAGESDVTFLSAEGNQFLKKYVGEGSEAVHALFNAARKYAPSIVFIDEIDAIGKDRNQTGLNDSTGDVLTALLTELDGFKVDTSKPVFVLAATNYNIDPSKGKSLDAALLRRFDSKIYVDLPNKEERRSFIYMKIERNPALMISDEQVDSIALRSTGMSLAELDTVLEAALRSAIRAKDQYVRDEALEEAFEAFHNGEKKEWDPETLERTARHEAGHALLCWLGGEKPTYLTIVARGDHGGYMQHANEEGKGLYTKAELLSKIRTSLGGRAAELVYYGAEGGVSTGASGDLYTATRVAEQMICNYGMDADVGLSYVDRESADPAYRSEIRSKVNAVLEREMDRAVRTLDANREAIDAMVTALMEKTHMKGNEIDAIFRATAKEIIFT